MAWSTRQLAELAGTTVKAVRHYHKLDLLPEPERGSNGYKRYGVDHLIRLLRIRRLVELGVSLAQIASMGDIEEHPDEALRELDAELASAVERLQQVRAELALVLEQRLPTDLPPELAEVTGHLSDADRAMMVVNSRVLGPDGIKAYARMLSEKPHPTVAAEFDDLPPEADEPTRADLAERMLPYVVDLCRTYPEVFKAPLEAPGGFRRAVNDMALAISDIYNPAQKDVLDRIGQGFAEAARQGRET